MVKLEQHADTTTLLSRILLSAVMWLYGYFKLTGYAGAVAYMSPGKGCRLLHYSRYFRSLLKLEAACSSCSDIRRGSWP